LASHNHLPGASLGARVYDGGHAGRRSSMSVQAAASRRRSGLAAWAALAVLACLLIGVGLFLTRVRQRPFATQFEMEQRGLQDGQARGIGQIEQVHAISTTLGRVRPNLTCGLPENLYHVLLVAARVDSYNPCDPSTRLWVVELRGNFTPPFFAQPIRFIYTAAGDYIRSEGGPE
jgi:hypothetical protein